MNSNHNSETLPRQDCHKDVEWLVLGTCRGGSHQCKVIYHQDKRQNRCTDKNQDSVERVANSIPTLVAVRIKRHTCHEEDQDCLNEGDSQADLKVLLEVTRGESKGNDCKDEAYKVSTEWLDQHLYLHAFRLQEVLVICLDMHFMIWFSQLF